MQFVHLLLFSSPTAGEMEERLPMEEDNGVWCATGPASWLGKYYLYEVVVFHPSTGRVETGLGVDPYSRRLFARPSLAPQNCPWGSQSGGLFLGSARLEFEWRQRTFRSHCRPHHMSRIFSCGIQWIRCPPSPQLPHRLIFFKLVSVPTEMRQPD